MTFDEADTLPVRGQRQGRILQTSLELRVQGPGISLVAPLLRSPFVVDSADSADLVLEGLGPIVFSLDEGVVTYVNKSGRAELLYNEQPTTRGTLQVGATLRWGDFRILLWDRNGPARFLQGLTPEFSGTLWPLGLGQHFVGRSQQRNNSIVLNHPTVSREHAVVSCLEQETTLTALSTTNVVYLNGEVLAPTAQAVIEDGDILEVGEVVLRFRHHRSAPSVVAETPSFQLSCESLGGFQASLGGRAISDKAYRTRNAKWLLARLAFEWGRPLSCDALIDMFWPEATPESGRNNLNYTVSSLRNTFKDFNESGERLEYFQRTSSSLSLNPELLGQHDVVKLQGWLRQCQRPRTSDNEQAWMSAANEIMSLPSATFLEGCYLDWAMRTQETLGLEILEVGRNLLDALYENRDYEAVPAVGAQLLRWDRCCQRTYRVLMAAAIERNNPSEALRLLETCKKALKEELQAEPSMDLLREEQRARLLL